MRNTNAFFANSNKQFCRVINTKKMSDQIHSATERAPDEGALERAHVCTTCADERAGLVAEIAATDANRENGEPTELENWAEASFPSLEPRDLVADAVAAFQDDERSFDPSYDVTTEDPSMIEADIQLFMEQMAAQRRNDSISGQIEDGVPARIPAEAGEESPLLVEEEELRSAHGVLVEENAEIIAVAAERQRTTIEREARTSELQRLQDAFNALRADGVSTAEALRQVAGAAEDPDTKRRLNSLLSMVATLQTALPDKPDVVNRLLNTAGINLTAATVAGSFGAFMEAADADEALSNTDRATLRRIIDASDQRLRTGTQVRNAALQTTVDPVTGEETPLHTQDNKAEVAPGVFTYTETGSDVILEILEGSLHRQIDVTGLDGQSIGIVAEIMGLSAMAEANGATGFMKHVYGVDFERLTNQRVDPITLNDLSTKLSHLLGTGHDGEIMQPAHRRQLLLTQMRLVSPTGSLLAWEDDPDGYREGVVQLGLNQDAVLEAFGEYTQLHSGLGEIGRDQFQRHMHGRFPDAVSSPDDTAAGDLAA